jgi:hypothetical protein
LHFLKDPGAVYLTRIVELLGKEVLDLNDLRVLMPDRPVADLKQRIASFVYFYSREDSTHLLGRDVSLLREQLLLAVDQLSLSLLALGIDRSYCFFGFAQELLQL